MSVNLSIKNAPDRVVQRMRERAERHHRSLQGELLAIIEAAVEEGSARRRPTFSPKSAGWNCTRPRRPRH